jgi:hypothetical protein
MKEKRKPKRHPVTAWCDYTGMIQYGGKRPNHIRCPKCRRRLIPKTVDIEPYDPEPCLIYTIPKHKIPYSKR